MKSKILIAFVILSAAVAIGHAQVTDLSGTAGQVAINGGTGPSIGSVTASLFPDLLGIDSVNGNHGQSVTFNSSGDVQFLAASNRRMLLYSSGTAGLMSLQATSNGGYSEIAFRDDSGVNQGNIGFANTGAHPTYAGSIYIESSGAPILFLNSGALNNRIDPKGIIGTVKSSKITTSNFACTSSSMANVTGLSAALNANTSYRFRAILYTTSTAGVGVRSSVVCSGATMIYNAVVSDGTTFQQSRTTTNGGFVGDLTSATAATIVIEGTITPSSDQNMGVRFSQSVTGAGTPSVVLAGSFLEVWGF